MNEATAPALDGARGTDVETGPVSSARRHSTVSVLVVVASVLVVHGTNVGYRFFYDDYHWLDVSKHPGWIGDLLVPGEGASIYRPVLGFWFTGMRAVFGTSSVPYHLVALGFMIAAALAVRWLALELGLENTAATIAGVFYGANAALNVTTFWMSAAVAPLAIALAVSSVALVCRPSVGRQVAAAALLACAIMSRDSMVMVPVVATIAFTSRRPDRRGLAASLRATAGLWIVAAAYLTVRALSGLFGAAHTSAYATDFFGSHVKENLLALARKAARFGITPRPGFEASAARPWLWLFWLVLLGLAVWAARRGSLLPLAGLAWFFISLVPYIGLINHPMEDYYLELALVGLALTVGSLVALAEPRPALVVLGVVAFVGLQAGLVHVYQERSFYATLIERTEVLEELSRSTPTVRGKLIIATPCPGDDELAIGGELFRVLRDDPDLEVRFKVVEATRAAQTSSCVFEDDTGQ